MNTRKLFAFKPQAFPILALILVMATLVLASCSLLNPTPNPDAQIQAAVAATLASIPSPTPYPIPTTAPSPTPYSLEGVFCEYGFCIGHPQDFYLLDQGSTRQPPLASTYGYGIIFGYSQTLFVEMAWTTSGPSYDPQTTMRYILEEKESLQGNLDAQLMYKLNIFYQPISTVSTALPYGGIASWQCGGRDFAWKVYTPQDGMAPALLKQALEKFRCQGQ
jgi:hypothetical protein